MVLILFLMAEAMHRRPYRVLVLEHIDRAAPEVLAIVQQIVDIVFIYSEQTNYILSVQEVCLGVMLSMLWGHLGNSLCLFPTCPRLFVPRPFPPTARAGIALSCYETRRESATANRQWGAAYVYSKLLPLSIFFRDLISCLLCSLEAIDTSSSLFFVFSPPSLPSSHISPILLPSAVCC